MRFSERRVRAKRSGRPFESDWAMFFRVRDGKIARFQAYVDTAVEAAAQSAAA
jgi:ketosteroid isomerase-like protein